MSVLESQIVPVERIVEDIDEDQEASWEDDEEHGGALWPLEGAIAFRHCSARCREDLEPVLKGVTCDIRTR